MKCAGCVHAVSALDPLPAMAAYSARTLLQSPHVTQWRASSSSAPCSLGVKLREVL